MSQLVFNVHYDPKEIGSNLSGAINWPGRVGASRQRAKAPFFHVLYKGHHQKVWSRFKVGFPTSNNPKKKNHLLPNSLFFS